MRKIVHATVYMIEDVNGRRSGDMRLRWCTAGLLRAEQRFRHIQGYKQLLLLVAALERLVNPQQLDERKKTA